MKRRLPLVALAAVCAAAAAPGKTESRFSWTTSGFVSHSFEGLGPSSYAKRGPAAGGAKGERLDIKLRAESGGVKLDFDATPDVTGKPPFDEKGRYDIGNLAAIGTLTGKSQRSYVNSKTGELVIEESDENHVKGRLDFKGLCKTGPEPGVCSVHATFDVRRER